MNCFEAVTPFVSAPAVFLVFLVTLLLVGLRLWVTITGVEISKKAHWQLTGVIVGFIILFVYLVGARFLAYG